MGERKTVNLAPDAAALIPTDKNASAWVGAACKLMAALGDISSASDQAAYLRALVDAQKWRVDRARGELAAQQVPTSLVAQIAAGLQAGTLRVETDSSPRPVLELVQILLEEQLMGGDPIEGEVEP